ncbi:hypothetical protein [Natronosalvus rutilus]|uniref:Uncharacterized protein n=1 Tax=Natronosalvus rutilus TaxID=2953753 RepID=A0A9E7N8I1_9EURY|nr:hypothetical protein [Natronosalvus rutilus]UTF52821.1 hypothetical protein NGM29_13670 [Natronosalvus rutilus]
MTIDLTNRERAIFAMTFAVGLVVGLWAGLFMLPAEALNVPTEERSTGPGGETAERALFLPVPRSYFFVTITAPIVAAWYSYGRLREETEESTDEDAHETIVDGGTYDDV